MLSSKRIALGQDRLGAGTCHRGMANALRWDGRLRRPEASCELCNPHITLCARHRFDVAVVVAMIVKDEDVECI
jgi:hypothetical protein